MMDQKQFTMLLAERAALQAMLAATPEEDVIDRGSFQAKLEEVECMLTQVVDVRAPAKTRLTSRGRPVVGTKEGE
ncbi:hypothetical protein FNU76_06850 [Chitinimonas arctica]|uniref:Uncharacterized protein n=1 Tax=Chitinimonas arctica TaxID=2594795 RepID=A0A516SD60_9NEIS|nr:hypothetical protein [Chitinimonas arctica]QDQ26092.1 hypothetical protein FNU76_06850 [Chitinimonas arctica]